MCRATETSSGWCRATTPATARSAPIDLTREAVVYRALQDAACASRSCAASRDALLVERAPGSDALASVADAGRRGEIERDLFGRWPSCTASDRLALPGFAVPADGWITRAATSIVAAHHVAPAARSTVISQRWLDGCSAAERTALCHGDAGPGNFLFEGARVTALLDWEFAHVGDPLDDLAWVAVRAQLLGGFGDLARGYRVWSAATGLPPDPARIEYYRALVLVRMAVSCRVALAHASARQADTTVYRLPLPYLQWLLPDALGRAGCKRGLETFAEAGRDSVLRTPILAERARR
jgi:hypothetical protein